MYARTQPFTQRAALISNPPWRQSNEWRPVSPRAPDFQPGLADSEDIGCFASAQQVFVIACVVCCKSSGPPVEVMPLRGIESR